MLQGIREKARILIVDDLEANLVLLRQILRNAGYRQIRTLSDPRRVEEIFLDWHPDLLLLDLHMPYLNGFQILSRLQLLQPPEEYLPILVLTADVTPEAKRRALDLGAKDFLSKPFDYAEVLLRIRNLLETRFLHQALREQNERLEERVRERTRELEEAQRETLARLARAAEFRDDDTGIHTQRVGALTALLAEGLGLPEAQVEVIRQAAPLHDVGKIGIPDRILLKPGRLTREEFEVMKTHTWIGARILSGGRSPLMRTAERIALTHHERWDGSGYPQGLAGEAIPLEGRLVALVDVFDALTHARPYKEAWPVERAVEEILAQRGRQFDPQIVDIFQERLDQVLEVRRRFDGQLREREEGG